MSSAAFDCAASSLKPLDKMVATCNVNAGPLVSSSCAAVASTNAGVQSPSSAAAGCTAGAGCSDMATAISSSSESHADDASEMSESPSDSANAAATPMPIEDVNIDDRRLRNSARSPAASDCDASSLKPLDS